jgi:hypothetical protein
MRHFNYDVDAVSNIPYYDCVFANMLLLRIEGERLIS